MEKFSTRMKLLRKSRELTQKQLSNVISTSHSHISEMESGRSKTTLDNAIKLAQFFNVSLDYLCGLTDNPNTQK
jgi:transcriptional regulator with XRE-family HTH domain